MDDSLIPRIFSFPIMAEEKKTIFSPAAALEMGT